MTRLLLFVLAGLAVAAYLWAVSSAPAHEWYDGACCDEQDCRPLAANEVRAAPGGWMVRNARNDCAWQLVEAGSSKIRRSQDESMHGCFVSNSCQLRCLYESRPALF